MDPHEIEIDDATYELLSAIAKANDDADSLAIIARIEPKEFRKFLSQSGQADNKDALQLMKAADSRLVSLQEKTRDRLKDHIRVSRKRPESMTKQITAQLTHLIESGALTVGSYLPSEHDLATSLKVARNVVRGSYESLMKAGRIQSEGRKGRIVGQSKGAAKESKSGQKKSSRTSGKGKKAVKARPAASKGAVRRRGVAATRKRAEVRRSAARTKPSRLGRK